MKRSWIVSSALLLVACGGGSTTSQGGTDPDTTDSATATVAPPPASTTTPDTSPPDTSPPDTSPPAPITETKLVVTGPEEIVFDWTTDRCEDEHIPDIAARAVHDAAGRVQLNIGHYVNYRMIGPELDTVVTDCSGPVLSSDYDPDPSQFNDSEWLGAPYTLDGETIYAIVHNEYRGVTHQSAFPGQCPSNDNLTCLDTSLTMAVSTDGGDTYQDIRPAPGHLVATMPYTFDNGVPSGLRQPSNIIHGPGDYFYVFSNISDYPEDRADFEPQWVCLMRTDDLSDPASWRYWDGEDFAGVFVNPYLEEVGSDPEKCGELASPQLGGSVNETVVFDEGLQQYVMMGVSAHPAGDELQWGIYYSRSDDLIEWSTRELLLEVPVNPSVADNVNDLFHAYPSVIDPDSASMNFETTDGMAYLYLARFNAGGGSLDRDLVRWPIEVQTTEVPRPDWNFDSDGDTEGWFADNDLGEFDAVGGSLVMETTGADPYFLSSTVGIPAAYGRLTIRMKVSAGSLTEGQLFFVTDADPDYGEDKSLLFPVTADGEFHDYELDVSGVAGWDGTVIQLRIDPVAQAGRSIEIDRIWFPE